jgi:hypothetical protein
LTEIINGRPVHFPAGVDVPDGTGFRTQARQLEALTAKLNINALDQGTVTGALDQGHEAATEATAWQPELTAAVAGAGVPLFKAYGLGSQLNRLRHETYSPTLFAEPWVAAMVVTLDSLSSALPPHAGRAVAYSIQRWQTLKTSPPHVDVLLPAQCELWRTVLAAEKKGTDLLEPKNYLDGAARLGEKFRATTRSALKKLYLMVAVIVTLFVGGIALLIVGPAHAGTTAAAGISAVLASAGLTWKGIGGAIGKLASKLEGPLWGAELDGAITDAITLKGGDHPSSQDPQAPPNRDYANRAGRVLQAAGKPTA